MRFTQIITSFVQSHSSLFVIGFCAVFFSILAYYTYQTYQKKWSMENDQDLANLQRSGDATIMLFSANWCKHCKAAKPIWEAFVEEYHQKNHGSYRIICSNIDCTDPNEDQNLQMAKYGVDSFPTILMVKDGKVIRFDASVTKEHLDLFVEKML